MSKKICMVNNNGAEALFNKPTGGIKRFWELYSFFQSEGYQVDVYCCCTEKELKDHNIAGYSLNVDDYDKGMFSAPSLSIYKNNKKIFDQIKDNSYDCVISFDVPSTITICLAKIKNINFFIRQDLIKYRKIQYKELRMSWLVAQIRLFIGWLMEGICIVRSERIISQCQIDIDAIIKRHPFLRKEIKQKSRIQINNINPSWVTSNNIAEGSNEIYDIGFIGNFDDERKGARILLDALKILFEQGHSYSAIFVGGGKNLEEYKNMYACLNHVEFVGYVNNPLNYIKSMRLMVVPSRSDSCPNTILEALYSGTPVIGANCGGIPEILSSEEWLFELNESSLSKKIEEILENHMTKELIINQRRRAEELTFNWGSAIEKNLIFR